MTWIHKVRRRVLWIVVGVGLTTLGVVSLTTVPAWPIVGVAVAALALVVNQMTRSLTETICLGCGDDLKDLPRGEHGTICPNCGSINEWVRLEGPASKSQGQAKTGAGTGDVDKFA